MYTDQSFHLKQDSAIPSGPPSSLNSIRQTIRIIGQFSVSALTLSAPYVNGLQLSSPYQRILRTVLQHLQYIKSKTNRPEADST